MKNSVIATLGFLAALPAGAADFCNGNNDRCWQWENCAINGMVQECAYGSSSATSGALMFGDGTYELNWSTSEKLKASYGSNGEKNADGEAFTNSTGVLILLSDGTSLFYPGNRE